MFTEASAEGANLYKGLGGMLTQKILKSRVSEILM